MARLLDNPLMVLVILLAIVLLFGAPRLPGMARSLGQSLRIFKSEVKEIREDDPTGDPGAVTAPTPRHRGPGVSSTSTDQRPADACALRTTPGTHHRRPSSHPEREGRPAMAAQGQREHQRIASPVHSSKA